MNRHYTVYKKITLHFFTAIFLWFLLLNTQNVWGIEDQIPGHFSIENKSGEQLIIKVYYTPNQFEKIEVKNRDTIPLSWILSSQLSASDKVKLKRVEIQKKDKIILTIDAESEMKEEGIVNFGFGCIKNLVSQGASFGYADNIQCNCKSSKHLSHFCTIQVKKP